MELFIPQFSNGNNGHNGDTALAPYDAIGDNICISYDAKTKMSCDVRVETGRDAFGDNAPYLVISGNSRKVDAWIGIELSVPRDIDHVTLRLRCYPSEAISPRIYPANGPEIILPDEPISDDFTALRIPASAWENTQDDTIRIGLMSKTAKWYAIGLMSVEIAGGNHA